MKRYALSIAWLISLLGTLGSLYFSLVLHLEPCHLCWYQRICLFPLIFVLGFAAWRQDFKAALYTLPQVFIGLAFAGYHVLIRFRPDLDVAQFCGQGPSCMQEHALGPDWVTIPMYSFVAFAAIAFFILYGQKRFSSSN